LRRPRVIRAGDQVSVDRPVRRSIERLQKTPGVAAGQAEAYRKIAGLAGFVAGRQHEPFGFAGFEGKALAGGGGQNESIDGQRHIMPNQPPRRRLVEFTVAKRRDQRQPEAMQARAKVVHGSISLGLSRRRDNKKPRPDGGVLGSVLSEKPIARVDLQSPGGELFSTTLRCGDSYSFAD